MQDYKEGVDLVMWGDEQKLLKQGDVMVGA